MIINVFLAAAEPSSSFPSISLYKVRPSIPQKKINMNRLSDITVHKDAQKVSFGATSNYLVEIKTEQCVGCGDCLEICPMDAISLQEEVAVRNAQACIGCGLCVSLCSSEALEMVLRDEPQVPPHDFRELMADMAASIPNKS